MKKIVLISFIGILVNFIPLHSTDFPVIESRNMKKKIDSKMDINRVSKEEMLSRGIALSYVKKILDYREKTGGFQEISEMKRIKGIGEKTYEKLIKSFEVGIPVSKKPLYINEASPELLKYYGFTNKEIKKIEQFRQKNGEIKNSLELERILDKNRYERYKKMVRYTQF